MARERSECVSALGRERSITTCDRSHSRRGWATGRWRRTESPKAWPLPLGEGKWRQPAMREITTAKNRTIQPVLPRQVREGAVFFAWTCW